MSLQDSAQRGFVGSVNTENQFSEKLRDDMYERIIAWLILSREGDTKFPFDQKDQLFHATLVEMYNEGIIGGSPWPPQAPEGRYATIGKPYLK
jgi:hypothetical protein